MKSQKVVFLLVTLLDCSLILASLPRATNGNPSSNFVSVAYFAQETGYYCGPASVQMALSYLFDAFPSQDELATELETDSVAGVTYTNKMRNAFDNRGLTEVYGDTLSLAELKNLNSQGYLVIILIYFDVTHVYQHYVLVAGYDASGIYVHDPWPSSRKQPQGRTTGANVSISEELLSDLWGGQNSNWGLVIPYSEKQIVPASWMQERWHFLVVVPAVVAVGVLAVALVRKRRRPDLDAASEEPADITS